MFAKQLKATKTVTDFTVANSLSLKLMTLILMLGIL
jgi:hypothetical protein